jgi:predicted outer membrane repeat protein
VRVTNCRFEGNRSGGPFAGNGGAIVGATYVADCLFLNNRSGFLGSSGGALRLRDGGTVVRSTFAGNSAAYGGALAMGSGTVTECVFLNNSAAGWTDATGGAIRASGQVLIESCTFFANRCTPTTNAGAISATSAATIRRCIVAGTEGAVCDAGAGPTWSCCDLFGNSLGDSVCGTDGGGNFRADALFCAADPAASLDVTIQSDSPCAPGHHPSGQACGLIGAGAVHCGSVRVAPLTWTAAKSLFR